MNFFLVRCVPIAADSDGAGLSEVAYCAKSLKKSAFGFHEKNYKNQTLKDGVR